MPVWLFFVRPNFEKIIGKRPMKKRPPMEAALDLQSFIQICQKFLKLLCLSWLFPFPMILIVKKREGLYKQTVYRAVCKIDILYNTSWSTKMAVICFIVFSMGPNWKYILWYFYVLRKVISKAEWSWFDCTMNSHANSKCIEPQFLRSNNFSFYGVKKINYMHCKK